MQAFQALVPPTRVAIGDDNCTKTPGQTPPGSIYSHLAGAVRWQSTAH